MGEFGLPDKSFNMRKTGSWVATIMLILAMLMLSPMTWVELGSGMPQLLLWLITLPGWQAMQLPHVCPPDRVCELFPVLCACKKRRNHQYPPSV